MMLYDTLDSHTAAPIESEREVAGVTFHDLMAGIGYLLFQWSMLDTGLDEEIGQLRRASGDPVGAPGRDRTVNERLAEWRALLSRGRRHPANHHAAVERVATGIQEFHRRHALVVGGFVAASMGGAPAIRCTPAKLRAGIGKDQIMTLREIRETIEGMELCRSEMALLRGLREH